MEADWEVEIGGDAPILDAGWPGFVDLRRHPDAADSLPEVQQFSELGRALRLLNRESSPVWTAKCDFWPLSEVDPHEFDTAGRSSLSGFACYIDLFPSNPQLWSTPDQTIGWSRSLCRSLHDLPLRDCRADLVVRTALLHNDQLGFGVTAYLSAVGCNETDARLHLAEALLTFAGTLCDRDEPKPFSKLQ